MPGLGHKSYLQFAPEATFGTAVTCTSRLELINWSLAPVVGVIRDPSLYAKQSMRGLYQGGFLVKGTFTVRANYEGLLEILRGVSGTYAVTTVETGVRDHVFTEGPTLKSYTLEASIGDVPAGKVFRVVGAKFTAVTIKGVAGTGNDAMLTVDVTVVAKDMQSNQTPTAQFAIANCSTTSGSPTLTRAAGNFTTDGVTVGMSVVCTGVPNGATVSAVGTTTLTLSVNASATASGSTATIQLSYPALLPVLFHQSGTVGWVDDGFVADGSARLRSFELSLENPHDEARFYMGSVNVDEPLRNDFLKAIWKFTQEFQVQTQYDAARAFTLASPRLLFQHPTTIGSTSKREMEFRSNQAVVTDFTPPVSGYGIIIATSTLEAYLDPTDASSLYMRVRNTEAALP